MLVMVRVFKLYKNKECGLDSVSVFPGDNSSVTAQCQHAKHGKNMLAFTVQCVHTHARTLYSLPLLVLYRLGRRYNSSESTQTSLSCLLTRGTSLAPAELSVPSP